MKMTYQNKYRMYQTVLEYLQDNAAITGLLTGLGVSITAFAAYVTALASEMLKMDAEYKGITVDKAAARMLMEQSTMAIANSTMAYANTVNNGTLYDLVAQTMSKLEKATEQDLINHCQTIHNVALTNVVDLGPWGVTAAVLTADNGNIQKFIDLKTKKRQKQTMQATSLKDAIQIFKDTDKLLKRTIDKAIFSLEGSHGSFVKNYKENRKILDLGHTYTTFKGGAKVKDKDVALTNVEIEFLNKKGEIFTVTTDEKGNYRERLDPDTYKITAMHPDMLPFVIDGVKILPGEIKVENMEMVPKTV